MPEAGAQASKGGPPLLRVAGLKVHFPVKSGVIRQKTVALVRAVDGVSFEIRRGETFSIVGESGCGKSTTALAVLRIQDAGEGQILFDGEDITRHDAAKMRPVRRRMQTIFQDPLSSLNPRMKVGDIIAEPLVVHRIGDTDSRRKKAAELMELCGLLPDMAARYPHEFSGGQRQRISIARALALEPDLVVCDEAVSALDVSIRAQILNLLIDLQKRMGLAYLFISHDLAVVRHISDHVGVMYLGQLVEVADRDSLFSAPKHPYTRALLQTAHLSVPDGTERHAVVAGEPPSPRNPPSGCRFHPRCPVAQPVCSAVEPRSQSFGPFHSAACHFGADSPDMPG